MPKSLKQRILKKRNVVLEPRTKNPITVDELPTPFHKTIRMRFIELKHGIPIQELVADGSIDDVAYVIGVDRSTVSKWRKRIRECQ